MKPEEYERILLSTWAMTDDAKSTYWHHVNTVNYIAFTCDEDVNHRLEVQITVRGAARDCILGCHFAVVGKRLSVTHITIILDKEGKYLDSAFGNIVLPNKLSKELEHADMLYRTTLHFLNVFDVMEGAVQRGEPL